MLTSLELLLSAAGVPGSTGTASGSRISPSSTTGRASARGNLPSAPGADAGRGLFGPRLLRRPPSGHPRRDRGRSRGRRRLPAPEPRRGSLTDAARLRRRTQPGGPDTASVSGSRSDKTLRPGPEVRGTFRAYPGASCGLRRPDNAALSGPPASSQTRRTLPCLFILSSLRGKTDLTLRQEARERRKRLETRKPFVGTLRVTNPAR